MKNKITAATAMMLSCFLYAQNKRPNVLFIAIDDLRDFIGSYGTNPDIKTPNIDRLVRRGILFTNAHAQAPLSAPSRNSLMSGMLPSTTGAYDFQPIDSVEAFQNVVMLHQHFQRHGYYTAGTGKIFHNDEFKFMKKTFDSYKENESPYINNYNEKVSNPEEKRTIKAHFYWGPTDQPDSTLDEVRRTNYIISEINKKHDRPFFLAIGFIRPHLPFVAPRRFFDMYPIDKIHTRSVKEDDLNDIPVTGKSYILYEDEIIIRKNNYQKEILQAYYACVSYVDEQVGRLLDALDNSKYSRNTIIVLWSDNGWHFGEKRTWRKFTLWQESTKVPLIIVPAGGMEGHLCNRPVQLVDVYPTLVTMCGLPFPDHKLEGRDLSPLLANPEKEWKYPALTTYGRSSHALTTETWKYIKYFDGSEELYNLKDDPNCWTNLAGDSKYNAIKNDLNQYFPRINVPHAKGCTREFCLVDYPDVDEKIKKIKKAEIQNNIKILFDETSFKK